MSNFYSNSKNRFYLKLKYGPKKRVIKKFYYFLITLLNLNVLSNKYMFFLYYWIALISHQTRIEKLTDVYTVITLYCFDFY